MPSLLLLERFLPRWSFDKTSYKSMLEKAIIYHDFFGLVARSFYLLHRNSKIPFFLLYSIIEKLIGYVLLSCMGKQRNGSDPLHVQAITGLWHYPVHFSFLPGFWGETDGDQHWEC